jgi:hypothetical protein
MAKRRKKSSKNNNIVTQALTLAAILLAIVFVVRVIEGITDRPFSTNPVVNQLIDNIDPVKNLTWEGQ